MGDISKVDPPKATITTATINLIKNVVAAGTVTLPYALKCTSLIPGLFLLLIIGILSGYSFILLARCCSMGAGWSYKEIAQMTMGPRVAWWSDVFVLAYTAGSCISFIVLIGDTVPNVLSNFGDVPGFFQSSVTVVILFSVILLYPLCALQDLEPLKASSSIGNVCVLFTIIAVITKEFTSNGGSVTSDDFNYFSLNMDFFQSVPLVTVAFAAHYSGPKLFQELGADLNKWNRVIAVEFIVVFCAYLLSSWAGYAQYGSDTDGNVLKNYDDDDVLIMIARLAVSLATTFTFPFAFHSMRKATLALVLKQDSLPRLKMHMLNCILLSIVVFIGLVFPQIAVVIEYKGCIFGSFIVFIFPGLFYISLLRMMPDDEADESSLINATPTRFSLSSYQEGRERLLGSLEPLSPISSESARETSRFLPVKKGLRGLDWREAFGSIFLITFGAVTGIVGFIVVTINIANGNY